MRAIGILAAGLLAGCGAGQHDTADFKYTCGGGVGMFDGPTCRAPLDGPFVLYLFEFHHDQPIVLYTMEGGGGVGYMPPRDPESTARPYVRRVGINANWLIVEDNRGRYFYANRLDDRAIPEVHGPFTRDEMDEALAGAELPPLREAIAR